MLELFDHKDKNTNIQDITRAIYVKFTGLYIKIDEVVKPLSVYREPQIVPRLMTVEIANYTYFNVNISKRIGRKNYNISRKTSMT